MKDTQLIRLNSIIHLSGRLVLLLLVYVLFRMGGFFEDSMWKLYQILGPMSVLFICAFLRFALRYQYPFPQEAAPERHITASVLVGTVYIIYLGTILVSGLNPNWLSFELLVNVLFTGELVFAIFTALSLPHILGRFPLS